MSGELISRKDARFLVKQIAKQYAAQNGVDDTTFALKTVFDEIDTIPAVDAVEVVRCKDCVLWKRIDEHTGKCPFLIGEHQYAGADHYCSCGERKGDNIDG